MIVKNNIVSEIENEVKNTTGDTYPLYKELRTRRKLLLFINPFGGRGTAIRIWNQVKYLFGNNKIIFILQNWLTLR